jgi:hypothetical protein
MTWQLKITGTGIFSVDNHVVNEFYFGATPSFGTHSGWDSSHCQVVSPNDKLNTYGGSLTVEAP